ILAEELIAVEDMVVTRTRLGFVKRTPVSEYQAQNRGGVGIKGAASGDDDFVADMFVASTHAHLLLFTNSGRVYSKKVHALPAGSRTAKGRAFVNVLDLQKDERVIAMLPVQDFGEDQFLFMATESGTVKKTVAQAFSNIRSSGIRAIGIEDGDRLVDVRLTDGNMDVLLTTANGYSIRFSESNVRPMGRDARGVRGINLRDGDNVVGMVAFQTDSQDSVVTVCVRGYGKRTSITDFPAKNRGGKGVIAIKTTERNGPVTGVRLASDDDHLILISTKGKLIRMPMSGIPVLGRNTQGVRLMRVGKNEGVASIERLAEPDDESSIEEGVAEGATPEATDGGDTEKVDMSHLTDDGDDSDEDSE
ncbi:MAG: DNA gyrase subunit A, partial [Deltaproteobacteria bacterium]|nr:DNA gyrase subunit A [Deltaproteobacteria bacterium]